MRTIISSAVAILLATYTFSNEKMYDKLHKLYLTDRNKCMEKAKQLSDKKKLESIPHYFKSVIYYDKSKESATIRGNYLQLNRSVSSAKRFEQLSGDQERELVHWDEHIASLRNRVEILLPKLDKNGMNDLSKVLVANIQKVESLAKYFSNENDHPEIELPAEKTQLTKIEGHFYGMPNGNEKVISADISKEKELLILINNARSQKGLPALQWSENLANASRYHGYDQATQAYLSHSTKDVVNGNIVVIGDAMARIKKFIPNGQPVGECIAAGNENSEATFKQWMESNSHKQIIMDPSTKYVGIGYVQIIDSPYTNYWVLSAAN